MKKLSKLLCAVLVLAMLCSSLIFMVGAEEETPAYSSVATTNSAEVLAAIKYGADDNLVAGVNFYSGTINGWNNDGARSAHLVTNNKTGETYYHEFFEGTAFDLKEGQEQGNEYIDIVFTKQKITYEEGYNDYIIVEYDLAHTPVAGKYINKAGKEWPSQPIKQQVIGRNINGSTSWPTAHQFQDFGVGGGFSHVTTIHDYTSGNSYLYIDGTLAKVYTNGALAAAAHTAFLAGKSVEISECRLGSNSYDEYHLDNLYIRHEKNAASDDTVKAAIDSGKLSDWNNNIYDAEYVAPTPYWFVKSGDHATGNLQTAATSHALMLDGSVNGNLFSGSSIGNSSDLFGAATSIAGRDNYITIYGANTGTLNKVNTFVQLNAVNAPNVSVVAGTTAYYVIDFDIATHGEILPYIDISVMLRRVSDGGGFPFSVNVEVASYIDTHGDWAHITLVGDMGANLVHLYVDGEYKATPGYAYNDTQLSGNTELSPKGIRVDIGLSSQPFDIVKGQNIALDNFSQRVYTGADLTNGLAEAVAAGNLNTWAEHAEGNTGKQVMTIATVNGVAYQSTSELATALLTNEKIEVEFLSKPLLPVALQANAVINTNGFDPATLFTVTGECEIVSTEGNIVTTYAPFTQNKIVDEVNVPGGVNIPEIYNAIKYNVSGNLFSNFTPISLQYGGKYQPTWGSAGYRKAELITNADTGDVIYRESATLLPDGTMAEGNVYDADGNIVSHKTADSALGTFVRSNEYVNMYFNSVKLTYEAGKTEYIVVDFDFGSDTPIVDEIAVQMIPRVGGSGSWASDVRLKNLPITVGEMAHVTLVFDYSTNNAYVFINGEYKYTVAEGAMDGDFSGGRSDGSKWADRYLLGEQFTISEFKLTSDQRKSTVCFDNVAIRSYDLLNSEDVIGAAVATGDITNWEGSIYNDSYVVSKLPAVASVDGVDYGSVEALNEALAVETGATKEVYIKHTPMGTLNVLTDANVETNGLDVEFNYETGLYKFFHDDPYYVCTGTDYAYASNRLVLAHDEGSTVYSFVTINKDNCASYATPIVWFHSLEPEVVEVVFYAYGDQIAPLHDDAYIEDGKLYADEWHLLDAELNVGEAVDTFPVSSSVLSETWYSRNTTVKDADFAASDIKQGANVSSNVQFSVYVNKSETVSEGDVTVIGGVEYLTYTFEFAPHEFANNFVVEFEVADADGKVYLQRQNVSFLDYAADLLGSDEQSEALKSLVAGILNYANEAHKLFKGDTVPVADALLMGYASLLPTATPSDVQDTAALSEVIRSAAMKLNETPEFLFKVALGFKGTLEFTYTGVNGEVKVSQFVDATDCETFVTLDSFDVSDIFEDITISVTKDGEDTPYITGEYNLTTYANGLADPAFANALMAYAQAAKDFKVKYSVYLAGKLNVTDLEAANVQSATLKTIVASKIKQCDQSNPGADPATDPFAEGGTPRYVLANLGDGRQVEALYFSRSVAWTGSEKAHFTEFRFAVNNEQAGAIVTSITFDYLVNGTVKTNDRFTFTDLDGTQFKADAYVQIKTPSAHPGAGDNYPELKGTDLILDGQWHTMSIDLGEGVEIIDVLLNLYQFQGEMLIANLALTYAE